MKIAEYVEKVLERQGRTKLWLAELMGVNYKTLVDRLKNDRLTAYDLLKISNYLSINTEELKGVIGLTKFSVEELSEIVRYIEVEQSKGIYEIETKRHPSSNVKDFLSNIHNYNDDEQLIGKLDHLSKSEAKVIYNKSLEVIKDYPINNETPEEIYASRKNRKESIMDSFKDILQ